MPQLLMVSRTPSLAMGLAGAPFDVVVRSPNQAPRADEQHGADALLVDVQSADSAVLLVEQLRDPLAPIPAIVLAGPDWDRSPLEELSNTRVVVRPVNQHSLVATLTEILAPVREQPIEPAAAPVRVPDTRPVDAAGLTPTATVERLSAPPQASPAPAPLRPAPPPPAQALPPAPRPVVATAREEPARPRTSRHEARPIDLVRSLLPRVDQLASVEETSDVVLTHALGVVDGHAGAMLLREEDRWVVAAGSGLRPLEFRCELPSDHWLVSTVCLGHKGILVKDTDIARSHLTGAPLASWRHLAVVPVSAVEGALILARRDDPPFIEQDLARLAQICEEASEVLTEALAVRQLARAMARYLEPPNSAG